MLKDDLISLGFTPNQAEVYLALSRLKTTKVGALINATGFHRNIVYRAIDDLKRKKLVTETILKGVKHYTLADPSVLIKDLDQKKILIKELVAKLKRDYVDQPEVLILTGIEGHKEVLEMESASTTDVLLLGINYDLAQKYPEIQKQYNDRISRRKINVFVLAYQQQKKIVKSIRTKETRFLPTTMIPSPVVTAIYEDKVIQTLWTDPIVDIIIKSKEIADNFRQYFWLMWKNGKKKVDN